MTRLGYHASLQWLLDNDDTQWLDDPNGVESVTLALVADIFGKTTETATGDLRRLAHPAAPKHDGPDRIAWEKRLLARAKATGGRS